MDNMQISQVGFGEILYDEVENGEDGVNVYSNLGRNQWALRIDDLMYKGRDMTKGQKAKLALIDSASLGIMLPEFVWNNILVEMQHNALVKGNKYSVIKAKTEKGNWEIQIPNKRCSEVVDELSVIQFKLEQTNIIIQPSGYTYQIDKNQDYCQVGLQPIMHESHEYRLGNIFLRNFYTALDFDKDVIMIGVNKGSAMHASAQIYGETNNPYKDTPDEDRSVVMGVLVLFYLLMCTAAFIYFFVEKRKINKMSSIKNPVVLSQQSAPPQI